jgi:molecular chaperone HtpG
MQKKEPAKYTELWKQFGRVLKEGPTTDFDNKDKLVSLALFDSSDDPEKLTTLREYVGRMKEGQNAIYYLAGPSRRAVENSPHVEAFREKNYEVLYLVDPVDEVFVQWVPEFEGKKLKSVGKGVADIGEDRNLADKSREFADLIAGLQRKLEDRVKEVRLSGRLTSSPACLVVSEGELSPNLEKLVGQMKGDTSRQKRIMELNPDHELISKMRDRGNDPMFDDFAEVLYGYALLAEGSELNEPLRFNQALVHVLSKI